MKYAAAVLAFASYAAAQSVKACDGKAQPCLDAATSSSGICAVGDWYCGCQPENMAKIQGGATNCVIEACGGATGAVAVLTEVQAICKEALANPPATEAPEPTAPAPAPSTEPEPTDEAPAPKPTTTVAAPPAPTTTTSGGDCYKCNGTSSKPEPTHVTAGAALFAPVGGLLVGLVALAL